MLSEKSGREKITITIKKENKKLLEQLAESQNRNISRQVDHLIESCFPTEEELLKMVEQSKKSKSYSLEEAKAKLGSKYGI